jgi:hypothetical protein
MATTTPMAAAGVTSRRPANRCHSERLKSMRRHSLLETAGKRFPRRPAGQQCTRFNEGGHEAPRTSGLMRSESFDDRRA